MAAGTRECERLPRDLRCAERAGAEPREQCSREKQAQQRREKARRFPPPSRVLRVSKFDSNRPSFDRAKKILTGRNVLLRRSIGIAPRFERARVPNSKILESFALVAPSGSRLLGLSGPRDRATRIQSRGFGWGSRGQQVSVRWRARTGLFALKSFLFSSERGARDLAHPARRRGTRLAHVTSPARARTARARGAARALATGSARAGVRPWARGASRPRVTRTVASGRGVIQQPVFSPPTRGARARGRG